jgi:hypothetical protein
MKAILFAMWLAASASQAPADFSGQWVADPPAEKAPGDMGSGWGATVTIAQDARQLVVEQPLFSRYDLQPPVKTIYALDGSESRNTVMTGHAAQLRISKARWDGSVLHVVTLYPGVDPATGKSFTTEVTQRLSIESPGVLVIASTRAGALGGSATTARTIYRKK